VRVVADVDGLDEGIGDDEGEGPLAEEAFAAIPKAPEEF